MFSWLLDGQETKNHRHIRYLELSIIIHHILLRELFNEETVIAFMIVSSPTVMMIMWHFGVFGKLEKCRCGVTPSLTHIWITLHSVVWYTVSHRSESRLTVFILYHTFPNARHTESHSSVIQCRTFLINHTTDDVACERESDECSVAEADFNLSLI